MPRRSPFHNSYPGISGFFVSPCRPCLLPLGFAFNCIEEVLNEAKYSAEITHNHQDGIKGAQAYYKKIPKNIIAKVLYYLDITLKKILIDFNKEFKVLQ